MTTFNNLNTQSEKNDFSFIKGQSSVLHIDEGNNININGVNVIINIPSVGDVLCITRRKDENDNLLGPDKQDIVWMKGNTIEYKSFPQDLYEPVGVVYRVLGRKAYVTYGRILPRERNAGARRIRWWGAKMTDGNEHTVDMLFTDGTGAEVLRIDNATFSNITTVKDFVNWLNDKVNEAQESIPAEERRVSVEYLGPTDLYGNHYDGDDGRCIINITYIAQAANPAAYIRYPGVTTAFLNIEQDMCSGFPIVNTNIHNSGVISNTNNYCNFYRAYTKFRVEGRTPTAPITSIFETGRLVNETAFNESEYCQFLRDYYPTYIDYFKDNMLKYYDGQRDDSATGLYVGKAKELTKLMSTVMYKDPADNTVYKPQYPHTTAALNFGVNHSKLTKGNWYVPANKDIYDMLKDCTLATPFWNDIPDVINQTLIRLDDNNSSSSANAYGFRFDLMPAGNLGNNSIHSLQFYSQTTNYFYDGNYGAISGNYFYGADRLRIVTEVDF